MKIAVTTSDGFTVDERFGNSKSVYIFRLTNSDINFLETRNMNFTSQMVSAEVSKDNFHDYYELIKDCRALYTAEIDSTNSKQLSEKGIMTIMCQGEISNILTSE